MKKLFTTSQYKVRNKRRAKKLHRRNIRHKLRKRNLFRGNQGKTKGEARQAKLMEGYTKITAPTEFSFTKYPERTVSFINKLENQYEQKNKVFLDLSKVTELDYSAICILVSVMFTFKSRKIDFNGSFPDDPKLKKMLIDSDFFKYLSRPIGDKLEYNIGKKNQIFTRANKEVNSELGLIVMEEASQTIWNEKRVCKGLQRTLLELMHNTNNHADDSAKGVKHWWLSVNHKPLENKVLFVFIDYGVGIFESLKNKPTILVFGKFSAN